MICVGWHVTCNSLVRYMFNDQYIFKSQGVKTKYIIVWDTVQYCIYITELVIGKLHLLIIMKLTIVLCYNLFGTVFTNLYLITLWNYIFRLENKS